LARLPVPLRIAIERKIQAQYREIEQLRADLVKRTDGHCPECGGKNWMGHQLCDKCAWESLKRYEAELEAK